MTLVVAAGLACPLAFIAWFEVMYLWFGITGEDSWRPIDLLIAVIVYGGALTGLVRGAERPAEVVHRACRLGIGLSIALPIVTVAVLLMWVNAEGRPDLGMGGLMLYSMPVVAFLAAVILVMIFAVGRRQAEKRLQVDLVSF
jgi:hypothetical protein